MENVWHWSRLPSAFRTGRIFLLLGFVASIALAWTLVSYHTAHAAGIIETWTQTNPWGVALDANGHVWVAEPGCDASPTCATAFPSYLGEYNRSNNTFVTNYKQPAGFSSPVFVAVDASGKVWFTEPNSNVIGRLTPGTPPTWKQWTVPTANAVPYDLVFDNNGNIWFTEYNTNKIGFFNPKTQTFAENVIASAGSRPYGITRDSQGNIWFAENNLPKIGNFTPTIIGKVTIKEHTFSKATNPPTAHLITSDAQGHIFFSEGFAGQIGEFIPSSNTFKSFTLSKCSTSCPASHISGISVDSKGMVWFDDSLQAIVGYLNPSTGAVKTLTLSSSNAHPHDGLLVDGNNNTWVAEEFTNKLGKIPSGTL
jgi:virginiamycin B lyase